MIGTITIPNYGNAETEQTEKKKESPQVARNVRTLPAPTSIADTGLPEEMLVQLLVRTLFIDEYCAALAEQHQRLS